MKFRILKKQLKKINSGKIYLKIVKNINAIPKDIIAQRCPGYTDILLKSNKHLIFKRL